MRGAFKFVGFALLLLITALPLFSSTVSVCLIEGSTITGAFSASAGTVHEGSTESIPVFHFVGGFSVVLSEVRREGDTATLYFVITRVANVSSRGGTVKVILTDDHDNEYSGTLNVNLGGAPLEVIPLLPIGFTYVDSINIRIPKQAPIETIRLGDEEKVSFENIKFIKPRFRRDFGPVNIDPNTSVPLGKYLTFKFGGPTSGVIGWTLPVIVINAEYNPITVDVKVGAQFLDGKVTWNKAGSVTQQVSGSSNVTLKPQIITISQGISQGYPRMILIYYSEKSAKQTDIKIMPVTAGMFPPIPERIAFERGNDIYVAKSDGSDQTRLLPSCWNPDWSPDGSKIIANAYSGVCIATADGANAVVLSGTYREPAWSPDGKKFACHFWSPSTGSVIAVVNADGSGEAQFVARPYIPWSGPDWSPDGSKIVYDDYYGIYIVASNGTGEPQRLVEGGRQPAWSPDGKKIAFVLGREIYVINIDGTGMTKLATGENSAWSPDGGKIIFNSARLIVGEEKNIYVMNSSDGSNQTKLIMNGERSAWAPAFQLEERPIEWDVRNSSEISCSIYNPLIGYGETIKVTGSISPARSGASVLLTYTKPDGTTLTHYLETNDKGEYAATYLPDKVGLWTIIALWIGDEDYYGAASSTINFIVSKEIITFNLSSGWEIKELFVPIYYRSFKEPDKVVLGVGNKRDMWYLVKVYKRLPDKTWGEIIPQEFLGVVGPYIGPYSEKTFIFPYVLKEGDEIKIEVLNDLNDNALAALWALDLATRAFLGVSISPQITEWNELKTKLLTFYNDYLEAVGYLRLGKWKQALLQFGKALVSSAKSQEFADLLKHLGVKTTAAKIATVAAKVVSMLLALAPNIPIWWDLFKNSNREPFREEVIFTAKKISPLITPDVKVTKSLTIVQNRTYYVGETINAQFTIRNKGTTPITFRVLTVGGRGPKGDEDVRDFTFKLNITLNSNQSYNYEGELKLLDNGSYHFFIAYQTMDGKWITSVPTESGIINTLDINVNPIPEEWIGAELYSPAELRIYDSEGRITGLVNGKEKNEIPHSACYENIVVILSPSGSYKYQVVGTSEGSYNLTVISVTKEKTSTFTAIKIPTLTRMIHQYTINWDALSKGEKGVTLQIDSNGDGTFEKSITADSDLTRDEYPSDGAIPFWVWIAVGAVIILVTSVIITRLARRKRLGEK